MKKLLIIIIAILSLVSCKRPKSTVELIQHNDSIQSHIWHMELDAKYGKR